MERRPRGSVRVSGVRSRQKPRLKMTRHTPPTKGRKKKKKEKERAAPSEEAEGSKRAAQGTRKGPRCKAIISSSFDDDEADSSRGGGEDHEEMPPPRTGEEKKRKAAPDGEARMPKKGKASLPDYSTTAAYNEEWLPRGKPPVRS